MKTTPIVPARIVIDDDGTPRSAEYDDVYHPRSGALAQARHVFLDGDALAARWRGKDRFVILETGFGLGNNFLATWAAWRADPERCRQLHFISIEESPPTRATFASLERDASLAPLAAELARQWPPLTCNLHRIAVDGGGVELLLAFGAVDAWLPQLVADVDAFFLDGFAPARNPAMWDARLFKAMARLAAPEATIATWSAARAVRDGLRSAGFAIENAPGSGGKRDITRGRFAPRFAPRPSPRRAVDLDRRDSSRGPGRADSARSTQDATADAQAPVVIVGAGLAGCALARALAERGIRSLVLERGAAVAERRLRQCRRPLPRRRPSRRRPARALSSRRCPRRRRGRARGDPAARRARQRRGLAPHRDRPRSRRDAAPRRRARAARRLRRGARSATAASRLAGARLSSPAWHFPGAGWVDPRALARSWLADAGASVRLRLGCAVASLHRIDAGWELRDPAGATIAAAPVVVLCNGDGALAGSSPWPIRRQRGQISAVAASELAPIEAPRLPIAGAGYVVPAVDGTVWFGASSAWDDDDPMLRRQDQQHNLDRLAALLGLPAPPALDRLVGRVGFRWATDDRLPIIGAVPASVAASMAARLRRGRIAPLRSTALRRAGAGAVRVLRARLARHRVGGVRR